MQGTLDLDAYQELWQVRDTGAFRYARLLRYGEHGADGIALPFEDLVYAVVLGLHFAQRLYQELIPDGEINCKLTIIGVKGQQLGSFDSSRKRMDMTN